MTIITIKIIIGFDTNIFLTMIIMIIILDYEGIIMRGQWKQRSQLGREW